MHDPAYQTSHFIHNRTISRLFQSSDFDKILVHSLSISRDGGILDWDDLVSDVLDDREQVCSLLSCIKLLWQFFYAVRTSVCFAA